MLLLDGSLDACVSGLVLNRDFLRRTAVRQVLLASLCVCFITSGLAFAACPSMDATGDCFVDIEDFAVFAGQWLTGDPCVPGDMAYIPDGEFEMGDHFAPEGNDNELPVHAVLLDAFFMSKYEITNQQYCDYLNSASGSGSIYLSSEVVYGTGNDQGYCDTWESSSYSQIAFSEPDFSVRTKGDPPRDMSDDPMVEVSWYGAVAYCNWRSTEGGYENCYNLSTWECDFSKHGYRLATEAEWEYAARGGENSPYYRFPWGDTINHDYANYYANGSAYSYDTSPYTTYTFHPDWNDGIYPYTSVVGSFSANGYGLYDMAGNVWEWCNDWYDSNYYSTTPYPHVNPEGPASGSGRVLRGGSWSGLAYGCRVASRYGSRPDGRDANFGFRIVLDLE
jgi:formylglycine-generating enzyme required for sulfatase activity